MRAITETRCPAVRLVAIAAVALALGACSDREVVAVVGKTKVRRADVEGFQGGRGRPANPAQALDAVVERTLLAEGARRDGLADDPAVRARLAAAEREILAQAFVDRAVASASAEDALLKRYRDKKEALARRRIHVAHIAVRAPKGDAARRSEAESKLNRAYMRLLAGEPFEKVAREMSDDEVSAPRGGDLGPLLEGEVNPAFFEAAAALEKGKTSKPFESALGFHLAKALEPPATVTPPFEEAKALLAAEARREALEKTEKELRDRISVKTYPDRLPQRRPPAPAPGARTETR